MKYGGLVLALVFLSPIHAANVDAGPAIEFTGVIVADGKTKIALTEKATGKTDWIESGGSFRGYTVSAYDSKADAITVKKDGREEQLRLVAAKATATTTVTAPPAPVTVAPAPAPAAPTAAVSPNANLALAANPAPPTVVNVEAPPAPPPATVNVSVVTPTATPIGTSYTVQAGDSLNKISGTTGVSIDQLKLLNPDLNPNALLDTGKQIRIK